MMGMRLEQVPAIRQTVTVRIGEYVALRQRIAGLEAEAAEHRKSIGVLLDVEQAEPGTIWPFEGVGTARLVRGRVSEKLDRAKLAKAGVALEVLDAATVRTEGAPSLRIEGWVDNGLTKEGEA